MPKAVDVLGLTYGRLTITGESARGRNPCGQPFRQVTAVCTCGAYGVYRLGNIRKGITTSCGCIAGEARVKHGHARAGAASRTYQTWVAMHNRCYNPKQRSFKTYGAAGITVCDRWRDVNTGFQAFLADMGERPEGKTLDRREGHLGYFKENCRWATTQEQYENKRVNRDATGKFN